MTETSEALKAAKIQRRSAKASLTRLGNALNILREKERPIDEVRDYLVKVTQVFNNVVVKHEAYANLIQEDKLFEQEELWLDQCQNEFLKLDIDTKLYIESVLKNLSKVTLEQNEQSFSGMVGMQDSDSHSNSNPAIDKQASPPSENAQATM